MADQKATNIVWHQGAVTRPDREQMNGHKGCTVWLTGLSGSGKSSTDNGAPHFETSTWPTSAASGSPCPCSATNGSS